MAITLEDVLKNIRIIRNIHLKRIEKKNHPPEIIAKKLAGTYAFLTVIFLIILIGTSLNLGDKYEIPVLTHIGNFWGLKYLTGADKFTVSIKPNFETSVDNPTNISFVINSYKQRNADITVYLKSYESENYIPAYKYINNALLDEGESEDNKFELNVIPQSKGKFEICFIIDDKSFFSINKYEDCPSILRVIDSQSGDENKQN